MDSQSQPSQPSDMRFNLSKLPLEIRDLIWEFSLPSCRVFHVSSITRIWSTNEAPSSSLRPMFFSFHIHHRPPVASYTCQESRAVALRHGFFLSPSAPWAGVWFNPNLDILYFDRNQRTSFHLSASQNRMSVPGWDRVLNVGLEWRAFFRDAPQPSLGETMATYWRGAIDPLYTYMPRMKTLNFIVPRVRHKGGVTWGREPYGADKFLANLLPLPDDTQIPWASVRNTGDMRVIMEDLSVHVEGGNSAPLFLWKGVREDMERALKGTEDDEKKITQRLHYPPEVVGWWLLREGGPSKYENPEIVDFNY
ncbi:hypothetical protein G7046_g4045 [Stylonectria norvegica]|nr:hypothetical protein G7046_g4045 [Stylonectria norvegica]